MYKNCKNVQYYILGKGSSSQLGSVLVDKRQDDEPIVVFLIDHFFETYNIIDKLSCTNTDIVIYVNSTNEPYTDYINELLDYCKNILGNKLPVAIVGVGGGTTMDIAKAISVLLTNDGKAEDYQGWDLVKRPGIFKIGVPTISGTGSEASRTAVMTSKIKKLGINSDYSVFDQIIMDSDLLKTVPVDQMFYTAMDCFIHDVESLRGSMIDTISRAYAEKSLDLLRNYFHNGMNPDDLMVASYFGGCAVANSNVGICHPLSYGLSLVLDYHHGIANCIVFQQLEEYYGEYVKEFVAIKEKLGAKIPAGIIKDVTPEQMDRMVDATLLNEKPLTNAFGEKWREIFTPDKVKELYSKM